MAVFSVLNIPLVAILRMHLFSELNITRVLSTIACYNRGEGSKLE